MLTTIMQCDTISTDVLPKTAGTIDGVSIAPAEEESWIIIS